MSNLTPRPTEYKGTVFRSKSEAVIARALDVTSFVWEYEPERFRHHDWTPDFWAVSHRQAIHYPTQKRAVISLIIEYKPSEPTETYMTELSGRMMAIRTGVVGSEDIPLLVCGNPFNETIPRSVFVLERDGAWGLLTSRWLTTDFFHNWTEAKNYRFDLKPVT